MTSSLASPFGYASLSHIDYITFLLAKSCKLLPVMFLHITIFRKRYPLYKYLVVAAVTAGVAVFTLHSGSKKKSTGGRLGEEANVLWGMALLGINLLFDGLTNSTQDYIFGSFQPYTGPQMMCANNMMSSLVTGLYLLIGPALLAATGAGEFLGLGSGDAGELGNALAFMARYPAVWRDVLGFAACGAVGQVFICKFLVLALLDWRYYPSSASFFFFFFLARFARRGRQNILFTFFSFSFFSSLRSTWTANSTHLRDGVSGRSPETCLSRPPSSEARQKKKKAQVQKKKANVCVVVYTLSTFSSVLLVTVTVTRKMFTMILSVVAFGHRLSSMQWLGVGLVFGGIGVEAGIARREKLRKEEAKRAKSK